MKIKEMYVEDYKILKIFTIIFDSQLTVLIGGNGSGFWVQIPAKSMRE